LLNPENWKPNPVWQTNLRRAMAQKRHLFPAMMMMMMMMMMNITAEFVKIDKLTHQVYSIWNKCIYTSASAQG
jgi:hypothetical protein